MKPTIGRIVHIVQPSGERIAGIVTEVCTDTIINASGFLPNGDVSGFSSLNQRVDGEEVKSTCWEWPPRV